MRWDIWKNLYFRLWIQFSPIRGCFFPNVQKANIIAFIKTIFFDTSCVWEKHPLHIFCLLLLFSCLFLSKFQNFIFFLILGELRELHAKFYMCWMKIKREMIFQSLPLLDCFYTNVTNFPIVQWFHMVFEDHNHQEWVRMTKYTNAVNWCIK